MSANVYWVLCVQIRVHNRQCDPSATKTLNERSVSELTGQVKETKRLVGI